MKITLINERNPDLNVVEQVLYNRGIKLNEISKYQNLDESVLSSHNLLDNIYDAVETTIAHIHKGSKILIQVDSDVDGYTSAALLYNYLEANFKGVKLDFQVHDRKAHGLIMTEKVLSGEYDLIFVPDAGSNEFEKHKILHEKGIDVIILDHHEAPHESEHAIVVNNQLSKNYSNKELSGVGIVMQFCRAIDDYLGVHVVKSWRDFLDLVAVGTVADMMDLRSFETKFLVNKGLEQMNSGRKVNKFLQAIINRQSYSLGSEITPMGIAFYIAPMINATVRVGTPEEREIIFKCFIDSIALDEVPSTKRGSKLGDIEIRVEQGVRMMNNIRNRQKREEEKGAQEFGGHIDAEYLNNNSLIILNTQGKIVSDLNGLIANQMQARYKRPTLVVQEKDGYIVGSGRGHETDIMKDFRQFIRDSKLAEFAEGHANAFGVKFTVENFKRFIKYANQELDYGKAQIEYMVDFDIDINDLDYNQLMDLAYMRGYWGTGVDESLLVIRNVPIKEVNILKNNTLKIPIGKDQIDCLKFRASDTFIEEIMPTEHQITVVDLIVKPNLNEFRDTINPQLFLEDITNVNKKWNF